MVALALTLVALAAVRTPAAAAPQPSSDDLPVCTWADAPDTRATYALSGSFTATLVRAGDRTGGEDACRLAVTDGAGATVFERIGWGVRVFSGTGDDLDGDGEPEAVLGVDTGGGNRCCWEFTVVHLQPGLPELATLGFTPGFQPAPDGGTLVEQVEAYYALGPSMAESPIVIRLHRFEQGRLVERTMAYCDGLLAPTSRGPLSRDDEWPLLAAPRRAASRAGTDRDDEVMQTRVAAMSMALQYHVCGRPAAADALVADVWPAADVAAQRRRLAEAVAGRRPK